MGLRDSSEEKSATIVDPDMHKRFSPLLDVLIPEVFLSDFTLEHRTVSPSYKQENL
jgi:hypothetical protein